MKGFIRVTLCFLISIHLIVFAASGAQKADGPDTGYDAGSLDKKISADGEGVSPGPGVVTAEFVSEEGIYKDHAGDTKTGGVLISGKQTVTAEADISESGGYYIYIHYFIEQSRGEALDLSLLLNNRPPFKGAGNLKLPIQFSPAQSAAEEKGDRYQDLEQLKDWHRFPVWDDGAYSQRPYEFYLEKGKNEVVLTLTDGAVCFGTLEFIPAKLPAPYSEYLPENNFKDFAADEKPVIMEAETVSFQSSKAITAFCDFSSVGVSPVAGRTQLLNALGGSVWNARSQSASWEFDVSEDGWYSVLLRYRQDYTDGRDTIREIRLDGEVPFAELEGVSFPYTVKWKDLTLKGKDGAYRFYLTKGVHTITLTPAFGEMGKILENAEGHLRELNEIYRKIIMITSSAPDYYRDYSLDEKIPKTVESLHTVSEKLADLMKTMPKGTNHGIIKRLTFQLESMYKKNETIASELSRFQSNISSFGTWINDQKTQPLALDQLVIYPFENDYKTPTVGILKEIAHGIRQFLYSFFTDYQFSSADLDKAPKAIEVWVSTGRDQAQIIRQMASESFIAENQTGVNLRVITEQALLPAIVAGVSPDVALGVKNDIPVNYASRGAVLNLSKFNDIDDICQRFYDSALTPLRYEKHIYALPETQTFDMLFYRTDIFDSFGWAVPKTWEQVKSLIFDLNKNNMQFGFKAGFQSYCALLFQNGGAVYSDSGMKSALDEQPAIQAFEEYTKFYKDYRIPVSYSFENRFRMGAMPIGIADYTTYNMLEVFAPEIKGSWNITPMPGTVHEDGTISNEAVVSGACSIIIKNSKHPGEAWTFLKWWSAPSTQAAYGNRIEQKLGASARYAPSCIDALGQIPWSYDFYNVLREQMASSRGVPQVPGGYFTTRHFNNAFRNVVYDGADARETLLEYISVINGEITEKRKEFGLPVSE